MRYANRPANGALIDPNAARNGGTYQFGTMPRVESAMRINGFKDEDVSLIKEVRLNGRMGFQLKLEMLNAFNRHAFAPPDVTPTDNLFGAPANTLTAPVTGSLLSNSAFKARRKAARKSHFPFLALFNPPAINIPNGQMCSALRLRPSNLGGALAHAPCRTRNYAESSRRFCAIGR